MDHHKIFTKLGVVSRLNTYFGNFFSLLQKFSTEKLKLTEIFENHQQLEVHNFEIAQHIDKQITDISSTINALKELCGCVLWGMR